jgi:hypothetical protein
VRVYFVPLTQKGKLALKLGFHHGWRELLPKQLKTSLLMLRRRWYGLGGAEQPASGPKAD